MQITRLHIENFRSIKSLDVELGDTTVFLGPNNAGKTAVLDAVRFALTRREGFTEHDVHRTKEGTDPRTLPPIAITLTLEEASERPWNEDLEAVLADILRLGEPKSIALRVTYAWNKEKETFETVREFLNANNEPLSGNAQVLFNFLRYLPLFWLGALRDAAQEFSARSNRWGGLLRGVHIPDELEKEVLGTFKELDAKIVDADQQLKQIAGRIGDATQVGISQGPGAARLNMLPMTIEDMVQRTGIVLRNEERLPWLPLRQHGQGLQSLAIIFLFQAVVSQQLDESEYPGMEAIFAIEEPEAHLHPHAARTLWEKVRGLTGQKMMTTHSPYFVQHVPLHDLRLVRLQGGCSKVSFLPRQIVSELRWNERIERIAQRNTGILEQDSATGRVAAKHCFSDGLAKKIVDCYRGIADEQIVQETIKDFRHRCRTLLSPDETKRIGYHGRRVRGEIFFAQRWILVEGVTEYMLIQALGQALDWPLDTHGVSVIDFQATGTNPSIYATLAEAFGIPWHMIVDGDTKGGDIRNQLLNRGFRNEDLDSHFEILPQGNNLEGQLIADGHEDLLQEILEQAGIELSGNVKSELSKSRNKTAYMSVLASKVESDLDLARTMPLAFVGLITGLRDGKR